MKFISLVQRLFINIKYYGLKETIDKIVSLCKEIIGYLENRKDITLFLSYRYDLGGVDPSEDKYIIERIEF
jgi:hypothetical protein